MTGQVSKLVMNLQEEGQEAGRQGDRRCWNVVSWMERMKGIEAYVGAVRMRPGPIAVNEVHCLLRMDNEVKWELRVIPL